MKTIYLYYRDFSVQSKTVGQFVWSYIHCREGQYISNFKHHKKMNLQVLISLRDFYFVRIRTRLSPQISVNSCIYFYYF